MKPPTTYEWNFLNNKANELTLSGKKFSTPDISWDLHCVFWAATYNWLAEFSK